MPKREYLSGGKWMILPSLEWIAYHHAQPNSQFETGSDLLGGWPAPKRGQAKSA
jgi:hypothetical protein